MTALRGTPVDFGYAPAREARLASDRAMARGFATSLAMLAGAYALAYVAAGWWPAARSVEVPWERGPADLGAFDVEFRKPPASGPVVSRPADAGVPVPVPEALVPEAAPAVASVPGVASGSGDPQPGSVPGTGRETGDPAPPAGPEIYVYHDEAPVLASAPPPVYPEIGIAAQVEGIVLLWALVGLDGGVEEVRVKHSVPLLDEAAVSAVRRWRFIPALANKRPVRVWVAVPVRFSLH